MVDPQLGDRALFPDLEDRAYLAHAAISPASAPVKRAAERAVEAMAIRGVRTYEEFAQERDDLRERIAQMIDVSAADIAFVQNTVHGLGLIATSIPWRKGQRILVFEGEYPSNVSPWQQVAARFDLELVFLSVADFARPDGVDYTQFDRELERGARLVAVSAVQFQTGLRMPLDEIGLRCRAVGAQLCVDAVQGCGAVPLDASQIDYVACGAHKWLMGIDGCGFLYVHPDRMDALRPAIAGAMSHVGGPDLLMGEPGQLDYERRLRGDVRVFEGGMLSSVSCAALDASVDLLSRLGVENIYAHVTRYIDALEPQLVERGFRSLRMPEEARRSCILSLQPPAGFSSGNVAAALAEQGIACSSPDGLLRMAPHWPNAMDEVPVIVEAVDAALAALR